MAAGSVFCRLTLFVFDHQSDQRRDEGCSKAPFSTQSAPQEPFKRNSMHYSSVGSSRRSQCSETAVNNASYASCTVRSIVLFTHLSDSSDCMLPLSAPYQLQSFIMDYLTHLFLAEPFLMDENSAATFGTRLLMLRTSPGSDRDSFQVRERFNKITANPRLAIDYKCYASRETS